MEGSRTPASARTVGLGMLLPYWRTLGLTGFVVAAAITLYMVFTIMASDGNSRIG